METNNTISSYSKEWVFVAKIISYLFHPLFMPTYVFAFLLLYFPYTFNGMNDTALKLRLFSVFWMTAFFPGIAVFLLWRLKFIDNIFLRTQKERIIPFFITMFFYWWMYYLSKNPQFNDQPAVLKFFYFGIFISTSLGVVINNFIKISLHGIGVGGALTALILFGIYYQTNVIPFVIVAILITGLVASSRFIVGSHTPQEMYIGLATGAVCQLIGYWFVL